MKDFIFNNKLVLIVLSVLLGLTGIVVSYITYGTEPWETIGGFMCGLGLGLFFILIAIKKE